MSAVALNLAARLPEVMADQFGMDNTGTTANDVPMANMVAWIAAQARKPAVYFRPGVYLCNSFPNMGIQNAAFIGIGEVRFRSTGTGNGLTFDGGSATGANLYNVRVENIIVEVPTTGKHAVFIRGIHHSRFTGVRVKGAGTGYNAFEVEYAVCTHFTDCTATPNEDGSWYNSATPTNGLHLTARNAGEQTSYCKIDNLVMEWMNKPGGAGVLLESTIGNMFKGGTAEGCTYGFLTGTTAAWNKIDGMDFESNATADIYEQGTGNEYTKCDTGTGITVAGVALWPRITGGNHQSITIGAGAKKAVIGPLVFNRNSGGGGTITNGDPSTHIDALCLNMQTQTYMSLPQGAITAPGSGTAYTNTTGNRQWVSVFGGTLTGCSITRNGTAQGLDASTRNVLLGPGDSVTWTYTGSPTFYQWAF